MGYWPMGMQANSGFRISQMGHQTLSLGQKPVICNILAENCMNMKEIGPKSGGLVLPFGSANASSNWALVKVYAGNRGSRIYMLSVASDCMDHL